MTPQVFFFFFLILASISQHFLFPHAFSLHWGIAVLCITALGFSRYIFPSLPFFGRCLARGSCWAYADDGAAQRISSWEHEVWLYSIPSITLECYWLLNE
jgi:hypothetical protein